MKFLTITLIVRTPDPVTGAVTPATERFRQVIDSALLAEELGFDGFGVGERHERPLISSSPPVVLSHVAALTSRIRLFTAVDKVHRYHEQRGHTAMHLHAEPGGLSAGQHRASLELFQAEIAPALRRDIPDPPLPWAPVRAAAGPAAAPPAAVPTHA